MIHEYHVLLQIRPPKFSNLQYLCDNFGGRPCTYLKNKKSNLFLIKARLTFLVKTDKGKKITCCLIKKPLVNENQENKS